MSMTPTPEEVNEQLKKKIQELNMNIDFQKLEINQLKTLNGTLNKQINDIRIREAKTDGKREQLEEVYQHIVDKLVDNQ